MSMLNLLRLVRLSAPGVFLLSLLTACEAGDEIHSAPPGGVSVEDVGEASTALKVVAASDSVAAGPGFACALLEGGVVKCWGANETGQLGQGDTVERGATPASMGNGLKTVNLGTGRTAKRLRVGTSHACAILDNDQIKCWGANLSGQLGTGDKVTRGTGSAQLGDSLPQVNLGTGRSAKAVAPGSRHTCAILDTNQVKCWGFNTSGNLGIGDAAGRALAGELGDNLPTVNLGAGRTAKAIESGGDSTCVILDTNQVKCWGENGSGQLGQGHTADIGANAAHMGDTLLPVDLGSGRTAKALAMGSSMACAVLDNGQVKCWGNGSLGQLGQGTADNRGDGPFEMGSFLPAVNLGSNRTALAISAKQSTVCVLIDTNYVKCWGWNAAGQLGLGDTNNRGDEPNEMSNLSVVPFGAGGVDGALAIGVSVGGTAVCATLPSQIVKCWGFNGSGALGLGDADTTSSRGDAPGELPIQAHVNLGAQNATAVSSGNDFTCALTHPGWVRCWGGNALGQLGLGHTMTRGDGPGEMGANLGRVEFGLAPPVQQISSRYSSSCAVFEGGEMKCWGSNSAGELGLGHNRALGDNPSEMGDNLPWVNLGATEFVRSVEVGGFFACALLQSNRVKCWGGNETGQLGLGDTQNRGDSAGEMADALPFVNLGTGRTAKQVAVGSNHACAILDTNQVKCWGWNFAGQLGLGLGNQDHRGDAPGEMGDALPAVNLGSGRTAKAITAGAFHTCALLDNDQVKCWGDSSQGALGLGVTGVVGDVPAEMGNALPAVDLGIGRKAIKLSASLFGTCAVLDNARVKCWGSNVNGALGLGDTRTRGAAPGEMGDALPSVFFGENRSVVSIAAGHHSCAVLSTGEIKCWGRNTTGELGLGDVAHRGDSRAEASSGYDAVDMSE